jgi:hypothetical protein
MSGETTVPDEESARRRDNGLSAASFVPLAEVDTALGSMLLNALGRAKIAAYLEPTADPARDLLYAASSERLDARTIVSTVWRANQSEDDVAAGSDRAPSPSPVSIPDPLRGRDTDAEFSALVADWHVDTVAAIRSAERDLKREDADWRARIAPPPATEATDEEEHFVPPPPPPLPRLSPTTVGAILLIAASLFLLVLGGHLGFGIDITFLAGIGGILLGSGMLIMKLRAVPGEEDDDGAVL